jgi:hypothetical protein
VGAKQLLLIILPTVGRHGPRQRAFCEFSQGLGCTVLRNKQSQGSRKCEEVGERQSRSAGGTAIATAAPPGAIAQRLHPPRALIYVDAVARSGSIDDQRP